MQQHFQEDNQKPAWEKIPNYKGKICNFSIYLSN